MGKEDIKERKAEDDMRYGGGGFGAPHTDQAKKHTQFFGGGQLPRQQSDKVPRSALVTKTGFGAFAEKKQGRSSLLGRRITTKQNLFHKEAPHIFFYSAAFQTTNKMK